MKIKHGKLGWGLSTLVIATSIISGCVIYANTANNNNSDKGVYASQGREITEFTATGNATTKPIQGILYTIDSLDMRFTIPNPSQYNSGDYLKFETKNLKLNLNNREIRINDVIVGKVILRSSNYINSKSKNFNDSNFQSLAPEDSGTSEVYHLVVNDNFKNIVTDDAIIDIGVINSHNVVAFVDHDFELPVRVFTDNSIVIDKSITIKSRPVPTAELQATLGGFYSSTDDGETIINTYTNFWVMSTDSSTRTLQVGDIIEHSIDDSNSGVAFDTKSLNIEQSITRSNSNARSDKFKNPQGVYWIDEENKATYKIIEVSPHRIRYQVVEPPKEKSFESMVNAHKLLLLDTSPNTIDYQNQKIKPIPMSASIYSADGQLIKKNSDNIGSNITGAKLVSYDSIKKRGSVIVKIQDEEGNKIEGFESDKLLIERQQEGTKYQAIAPEIEGYEFHGLTPDSAPQEGEVKEGVQNVILVFKKKSIIAQPEEKTPEEPKKQEVQTPNTGINNSQISAFVCFAGMLMLIFATIIVRQKKNIKF